MFENNKTNSGSSYKTCCNFSKVAILNPEQPENWVTMINLLQAHFPLEKQCLNIERMNERMLEYKNPWLDKSLQLQNSISQRK